MYPSITLIDIIEFNTVIADCTSKERINLNMILYIIVLKIDN